MSASIGKLKVWAFTMAVKELVTDLLLSKDLAPTYPRRSSLNFQPAFWLSVIFVWSFAALVGAQQPTAGRGLEFETVSIRPSHSYPCFVGLLPPNSTHFEATCVNVRLLLSMAFNTNYLEGGGSALDTFYDVRATTPDDTPWTMESIRPMLRNMLEQRFGLQVHAGKREVAGYRMVLAKSGPKMPVVAASLAEAGHKAGTASQNFIGPGHIQGISVNSFAIAGLLSGALNAPVIDGTNLQGTYNVDLTYAPDDQTNPDLPSLFTAVEEKLGLKLQPQKVSVDTIVIDHINAAPTPN